MFQDYKVATRPQDGPPRLEKLRAAMKAAKVDAFLIPRSDAHRGENVAPCDERLAWLTGFTGSAGIAAITQKLAAVFVDGRYTLQVRDQVSLDHFTPKNIPGDELTAVLIEALGRGDVVAYDPWLHTRSELERWQPKLEAEGVTLRASANLVDEVWDDRPSAPKGAIIDHPIAFSGEAHADKRARVAEKLAKAGQDMAILTLPDSIAWLLNIRGSDIERTPVVLCFAALHADGTVDLFVDPAKLSSEVEAHFGKDIRLHDKDAFEAFLKQQKGTVRVDPASAPVAVGEALSKANIEWKSDPCILPKAVKNAVEIEGAREAHHRDGVAMAEFLSWLDAAAPEGGLTEIDVAQKLEACRAASNALRDISFETICGAGANGAIVHYRVNEATNAPLKHGSLILVDSGGQYRDGTTDITRTISLGAPPDDARLAFTLVLKGMIAISKLRWPEGLAGRDIDGFARAALWAQGMDYDHGTGHGVGSYLGVHEGPASISKRSVEPIKPGMILSNEPGFYREGAFGIRIENLIVAQEPSPIEGGDREMMGFETLTYVPIDLRLVDSDLLTDEERDWLNAYHQQTRKVLAAHVSARAAEWLEAATRAI
jgi:Xaa-Pro aminopeptidase